MHQGYKQRVWNFVGSTLNGTGGYDWPFVSELDLSIAI